MHFFVILTFSIKNPLPVLSSNANDTTLAERAIGGVVTIGVNAHGLVDALSAALSECSSNAHLSEAIESSEVILEANIVASDPAKWSGELRMQCRDVNINRLGVYYVSGIVYYSDESLSRPWWKFWRRGR